MLCAVLFFAAVCSNQNTMEKVNMNSTENSNENTIFPKGEKAPADNFTGTVWIQNLASKTDFNNFSIGNVTFESGARSNWHTHPAGQTLLVTDGKGLYQEKGKPGKIINKGETIVCSPDIEHWHGASPESGMTHIAVTNFKEDVNVVWLNPVTDEEYKTAVK